MSKNIIWMTVRTAVVILFCIIFMWLFARVFSLTYPFWIAALFAWMLQPLVRFLQEKLRFNSGSASLFGLLGGILTISAFLSGLAFLIYYNLSQFFRQVPTWIEEGTTKAQLFFNETIWPHWREVLGLFDTFDENSQHVVIQGIDQLGTVIVKTLGDIGQAALDSVTHLLLGVPSFLVAFFFIMLSIYFMGKSWGFYESIYERHTPHTVRVKSKAFVQAMRLRLFGFIRAQIVVMIVTATIVFLALLILRVENAWMLAIVVGIAELLPYVGTGTILIPWFLYLFITGDVSGGVGLLILYTIVVIVRQLLEPKLLSAHMNLNPIALLISLFVGLQLFGATGLFIGPIILVLIVILYDIGIIQSVFTFVREGFTPEKK
ncbi:sporulation integral membrane protein YtvI [Bacillus sp. FSL W7-1360]